MPALFFVLQNRVAIDKLNETTFGNTNIRL